MGSLTNAKPSAIYRLRPFLPPDAGGSSPPAQLGIEVAPLSQVDAVASAAGLSTGESKGKEVAGRVDVGKVAEKVVKNVRCFLLHPLLRPPTRLALVGLLDGLASGDLKSARVDWRNVSCTELTPGSSSTTSIPSRRTKSDSPPIRPFLSQCFSGGTRLSPGRSRTTKGRPSSTGRTDGVVGVQSSLSRSDVDMSRWMHRPISQL